MAWAGNTQEVWNAAFNGALAGIFANLGFAVKLPSSGLPPAVPDTTTADYAPYAAVAEAWAIAVDAAIGPVTGMSTGTNGTTVPPTTAAEAATQQAYVSLVTTLSQSYWQNKQGSLLQLNANGTPHTPVYTDYTAQAGGIAAVVAAAQVVYTAASSLT
jgi:hypothetical protein